LREQSPELAILFDEPLLVLANVTENFLEPEHFVLESFDVQFFALSMRSATPDISPDGKRAPSYNHCGLPLRLSI
jgi:hypothetical protein